MTPNKYIALKADQFISRKEPSELVETSSDGTGVIEKIKAVASKSRLNRVDVDRLQQLRLQELAIASNLVPGQRQVRIGKQTMR